MLAPIYQKNGIGIRYATYNFLFPPRPEVKIAKPQLAFFENQGFWCQKKKNGTCTMVFARRNEIIFKTRHNESKNGGDDHKLWTPQGDHTAFFAGRPKWNVYVAELLHSKVSGGPRDELYIFDQIVKDGVQLVGSTFAERMEMLHEEFQGKDEGDQIRIAKRITLAKCFDEGFAEMFDTLKPEDEGLVLKNPLAELKPCFKADSNSGWQVKCRIPHRNYSF